MFTDKLYTTTSNGITTLSGKYLILKGIGNVNWSLTYDEGQLHTKKLNNVI